MFIVFLGPDGAGKSTLIQEFFKTVDQKKITLYHFCPTSRYNHSESVVNKDPHSQKPYSTFMTFVKSFFLIYQFILGYYKNVKPKIKNNEVVILDRYYYDLFIDKIRYKMKYSSILSIFNFMIPKPDFVIVLYGDANVIYDRKKEISVKEIERQITLYKNIRHQHKLEIDTTNSELSKNIRDIVNYIDSEISRNE